MCIAFHPQLLNTLRSVGTQRIVGILGRSWNCGILKNKGCEKGANFRVFSISALEQCLSAFYDLVSLQGRPLSMLPSHWETATGTSGPYVCKYTAIITHMGQTPISHTDPFL